MGRMVGPERTSADGVAVCLSGAAGRIVKQAALQYS
eukprot:COSAG01_NODE_8380_length_2807_cov_3.481905_1_plen_35_part_10